MMRLAVVTVLLAALAGCNQSQVSTTTTSTTGSATETGSGSPAAGSGGAEASRVVTLPNGLKYEDLVVGGGAEAKSGNDVKVHYTGTFTNGTVFDSSRDGDPPYAFRLGNGEVVKGWDEGIKGMKVGGRRILTVPPHLGYGERGYPGAIPPNSTLIFDVELMDVR